MHFVALQKNKIETVLKQSIHVCNSSNSASTFTSDMKCSIYHQSAYWKRPSKPAFDIWFLPFIYALFHQNKSSRYNNGYQGGKFILVCLTLLNIIEHRHVPNVPTG